RPYTPAPAPAAPEPESPQTTAPAYPQLPAPRPAFTGDLLATPLEPRPGEPDEPARLVRR
ncbi:hypothetical protein ACFHWE_23570, partial [Nocardiopsis sp. LOL_012]